MTDKAKPEPSSRGDLYHIKAYEDMSAHIATLTRKVEAIELSKVGLRFPHQLRVVARFARLMYI